MAARLGEVVAVVALAALGTLGGCVSGGHVEMRHPMTARPEPVFVQPQASGGAIFQTSAYRPLFEDRRARAVGDVITIQINEKLAASQSSKSSADRSSSTSLTVPIIRGLPFKSLQGAQVSASSDTQFDGKGETSNVNVFTGTITVTVVEALPNGNLVVSGEKQIGINHNAEYVRFSGVVSPQFVQLGNIISSTQVADVRLEFIGRGYIDSAQAMGWLQRLFLSVLPF